MTLIDLGTNAAEPVSLSDAKTWCRIDRSDEDALISGLIKAARETIEAETRLVLVRRSFRLAIDPVPSDGFIEIERHPLQAIGAITAYDTAGTPVTFALGEAVIERALGIEAVRVFRAVVAASVNGLEIDFTAGFAPGTVPENLKLALLRIVSAAYEVRSQVPLDQQPGLVPPLARALIAPYRRVRL